jgi:hypothetical protein
MPIQGRRALQTPPVRLNHIDNIPAGASGPLLKEKPMASSTTTAASQAGRRTPWWQTASWIGLILLGAFNIFAAASDLAAAARTGLPSDHAGTFAAITGRTWTSFNAAQPGVAHYVTLVERGYALHELVFAILFLTIVTIPLRTGQRWAWWASWTVLIAYLGYTLTFGAHDSTILTRSLIAVIALPILLLAQMPALTRRHAN